MAVEDRAGARLVEIAALLGCPVESFFAPGDDALDIALTYELLNLWNSIRQPQIRRRILETVRRETGRGIAAPEAAE